MVALAGVILIQKVWRHGLVFSRTVGVFLLVAAALVPFIPSLLPGLRAAPMPAMCPPSGTEVEHSLDRRTTTLRRRGALAHHPGGLPHPGAGSSAP